MRMVSGYIEVQLTRYVDELCDRCYGSGERVYGSTSTWMGGIGGAAMTNGVCDRCWGSGDKVNPWADLRKMRNEESTRIHEQATRLLERSLGAGLGVLTAAQTEIAECLEKLIRKRKHADWHTPNLAASLAKTLRRMANQGREYKPEADDADA